MPQQIKLIAHRGNREGSRPEFENAPRYVKEALSAGYDVEIDVRYEDGMWYLGHDSPKYEIPFDFLRLPGLWCHAKNIRALELMLTVKKINCFWHENDECSLTSHGWIWTFPTNNPGPKCICIYRDIKSGIHLGCAGICTDNVKRLKKILECVNKGIPNHA